MNREVHETVRKRLDFRVKLILVAMVLITIPLFWGGDLHWYICGVVWHLQDKVFYTLGLPPLPGEHLGCWE